MTSPYMIQQGNKDMGVTKPVWRNWRKGQTSHSGWRREDGVRPSIRIL